MPRVVHFCASLELPRRWSMCLEGLYRKRRSAPLVRLCSARLPAIVHSSAQDCRAPLRPPGFSPAETVFESACVTHCHTVPAAYNSCAPCCQWAPLDANLSSCRVELDVVGKTILLSPVLAQTCLARRALFPVAAGDFTHRGVLRKVLCSPSCSSRVAPVAVVPKKNRVTVLSIWCLDAEY